MSTAQHTTLWRISESENDVAEISEFLFERVLFSWPTGTIVTRLPVIIRWHDTQREPMPGRGHTTT